MSIFRDTRDQLRDRLRKDLDLPQVEVAEAVLEAATFCAGQGYEDMRPIYEKYPDLFCPYDGRLHRSTDCDRKLGEHQEAVRASRI